MKGLIYFVAFFLLIIGAFGIARSKDLVHAVVCLSVAQAGTYVLLLAVGYQHHASPPVFGSPASRPTRDVVDPLVQAMALTDIVVSATVTALLLAISIQIAKRNHSVDPDELNAVEG
ncbi:MAG: sodium:proton antiporter [Actinomycetota bacterium]|nr:sodium:proton antiporter [Actinomycetota bacterium]